MMSMLDYFSDEMNKTLVLLRQEDAMDPDTREMTSVWNQVGASVKCCVWSKSLTEKVLGDMWKADTRYVACLYPIPGMLNTDRVNIDGMIYALDMPDNVAFMDEVMLVGLRRIS